MLRLPELRAFLAANAISQLGESAFTITLGIHVFALTHSALSLGWLGLAEAIPAIALVLPGGHVADRASRRRVVIATRLTLAILAGALATAAGGAPVALFYAVAFLAGGVRAFDDPAATGLEAEILPRAQLLEAVSLIASATRMSALLGPVLGGFCYGLFGPAVTFAGVAALLTTSCATLALGIRHRPAPPPTQTHMMASIAEGLRFVFASQIIVGSMALDLFAVFFGGVTGLLPAFAADVLHTGPAGVGLMRGAASLGALLAMLTATRHPPRRHAGVALHLAIAGFGVGIIVFGLSRSLPLSLAALLFAGACDGISVVIRRSIVRVAAPDAMRGRVAAVRGLFVNASNELGTFESGMAASFVGVVPAVWIGGLITLLVVGAVAWRAPRLRQLDLDNAAF